MTTQASTPTPGRAQVECLRHTMHALGLKHRSNAACRRSGFQCGSVSESKAQVGAYLRYGWEAGANNLSTVCETGVFKGESVAIWMCSHPAVRMLAFDYKVDAAVEETVTRLFPNRVRFFEGSSVDTIPRLRRAHPDARCDIVSIDGVSMFVIVEVKERT